MNTSLSARGRISRLPDRAPLVQFLLDLLQTETTFETVFRYNALLAFTWLRARAAAEALAEEDVEAVRRSFTEYAQQPNTAFEPPE